VTKVSNTLIKPYVIPIFLLINIYLYFLLNCSSDGRGTGCPGMSLPSTSFLKEKEKNSSTMTDPVMLKKNSSPIIIIIMRIVIIIIIIITIIRYSLRRKGVHRLTDDDGSKTYSKKRRPENRKGS
jgi:hypothetical protein